MEAGSLCSLDMAGMVHILAGVVHRMEAVVISLAELHSKAGIPVILEVVWMKECNVKNFPEAVCST